jgi:hypothetical protein
MTLWHRVVPEIATGALYSAVGVVLPLAVRRRPAPERRAPACRGAQHQRSGSKRQTRRGRRLRTQNKKPRRSGAPVGFGRNWSGNRLAQRAGCAQGGWASFWLAGLALGTRDAYVPAMSSRLPSRASRWDSSNPASPQRHRNRRSPHSYSKAAFRSATSAHGRLAISDPEFHGLAGQLKLVPAKAA